MPLLPGAKNIGHNIQEMEQHGTQPHPHKQIVAIALDQARRTGADIPEKREAPLGRYRAKEK